MGEAIARRSVQDSVRNADFLRGADPSETATAYFFFVFVFPSPVLLDRHIWLRTYLESSKRKKDGS